MKHTSLIIAGLAVAVLAVGGLTFLPAVQAEKTLTENVVVTEQTASFTIEKMTCASCPITVKKAMQGVEDVKSANNG